MKHTGTMVAFYPPPAVAQALAVPGGEPAESLHVTLAYIKQELTDEDLQAILDTLNMMSERDASGCGCNEGGPGSGVRGHRTDREDPASNCSGPCQKSRATAVHTGKAEQGFAGAQEQKLADELKSLGTGTADIKMTSGRNEGQTVHVDGVLHTSDSAPFDVVVAIGGKVHGVEVKTITTSKKADPVLDITAPKITLKESFARANKAETHTVVFDKRDSYEGASPEAKAAHSGHAIYYRRGTPNQPNLSGLHKVKDMDELKSLMTMKASKLPAKAVGR